jgi:DNA-binding transcriptional LysR family regulator
MLDTYQLNIFLVAAELENFTEAAQHLNLSQPSVSSQIQSLEQQLGTTLFRRAGRHIQLTEEGRLLVPLAREMVHLSTHIEETMASLAGEVVGHLKLGCSTSAGKYILPRLIAQFRRKYPRVKVSCIVATRPAALQALIDGTAHLAVSSAREYQHQIRYRLFSSDPVVLIAPANHPWAESGQIDVSELMRESFILREEASGTRRVLEGGLAAHGLAVDQLDVVMEMANSEAIRTAVEAGIGVAFISRLVAAAGIETGKVVAIQVAGMDLQQDLYIGTSLNRPATRAQAAFWEFVTEGTDDLSGTNRSE